MDQVPRMPITELDAAATKIQTVYKSYRTRRNLADCALLVEQHWRNALDSAALKQSSISNFDVNKHEASESRWSRARTRAAKVGKGLKDEEAQKLALQQWLEAIDPRRRYGHNLHFYYDVWFNSKSCQPFFYWLDVGGGKRINLESYKRADLQRRCFKYLFGPKERETNEVVVDDVNLVYKQSSMHLKTVEGSKWIVLLFLQGSKYNTKVTSLTPINTNKQLQEIGSSSFSTNRFANLQDEDTFAESEEEDMLNYCFANVARDADISPRQQRNNKKKHGRKNSWDGKMTEKFVPRHLSMRLTKAKSYDSINNFNKIQ